MSGPVRLPEFALSGPGWFFSDVHAGPHNDGSGDFAAALESLPQDAQWLILGGDIFDFMAGENSLAAGRVSDVLASIEVATVRKRRRLIWIEGNHDFHLDLALPQGLQEEIYPDGFIAETTAGTVAFVHGDVQAAGGFYNVMRRLFRSSLARLVLWLIPARIMVSLADIWIRSNESRKTRPDRAYIERVRRRMARRVPDGADICVMGHLHDTFDSQYSDASGISRRWICNGGWTPDRTAVRIDAEGIALMCFRNGRWQQWEGSRS